MNPFIWLLSTKKWAQTWSPGGEMAGSGRSQDQLQKVVSFMKVKSVGRVDVEADSASPESDQDDQR